MHKIQIKYDTMLKLPQTRTQHSFVIFINTIYAVVHGRWPTAVQWGDFQLKYYLQNMPQLGMPTINTKYATIRHARN